MARTTKAPESTTVPQEVAATEHNGRRTRGPAINRVILVGRTTADAVLRYTSSGLPVTSFRLATNDRDEPEFHDCVAWRQLGEVAGKYLTKGQLVYVEGSLHGRTWQTEAGASRRSIEIIVEQLRMLGRKPAADES
jgi:single-strand DNA-binding protein